MNKIGVILFLGLILSGITIEKADAQVFKARALSDISTSKPNTVIKVRAVRTLDLGNGVIINKGYVVTGKMTEIVAPKKFHHNAGFTFIPTWYTDKEGNRHEIKNEIRGTYRQKLKLDFEHSEFGFGMATGGGDPSNNMFIFSPSYITNAKKIIDGEMKEVWDDYADRNTPWGKGEQIEIGVDEVIYFNFPDMAK